jgi:TolB-like protein
MAATAAIAIGFPRFVLKKAEDDHALLTVNAGDATPGVPRLLVEPFDDLTGTESSAVLAHGLTEEVIGQIAKFKDIVVVESTGAAIQDVELPGYKHADKPRYALVGSVQVAGDTLRMSARLLSRADGSVLWANRYDQKLRVGAVLDVESDIAASITTALAQPYGIVFQADAARVNASPPDDWDAYNCTLYYYSYQADLGPQTHASAQTCLQRAVERFPAYATAWALLSLTYIDEYRFKYRLNSSKAPPLDLAR